MTLPGHVVLLADAPQVPDSCADCIFDRATEEARLERQEGLIGTFMRHNRDWCTRAPLVFQALETRLRAHSGAHLIRGMLSSRDDVDMLAVALGPESPVLVLGRGDAPDPAEEALAPGGFVSRVRDTTDALTAMHEPARYGTFAKYEVPAHVLWSGPWVDHPLDAICDPVRPRAAAAVVQLVLTLAQSRREYRQFCGAHPISLDRENCATLVKHPYAVSPKVDGTRYFLLVTNGQLFFVNRACEVWGGPSNGRLPAFEDSLLDCEVTGTTYPTIMVIDVLAMRGRCLRKLYLRRRLDASRALVRCLQGASQHFAVVYQRYLDVRRPEARQLVGSVEPSRHDNTIDGFVFTPLCRPYLLGRCYDLLKWKPHEKNTTDLCFEPPDRVSCTDDAGEPVPVGRVEGVPHGVPVGAIVECRMEGRRGRWVFERLRPDKTAPNVQWVLERIEKTVRDNITRDDILRWMWQASGSQPPQEKTLAVSTNRFAALA